MNIHLLNNVSLDHESAITSFPLIDVINFNKDLCPSLPGINTTHPMMLLLNHILSMDADAIVLPM